MATDPTLIARLIDELGQYSQHLRAEALKGGANFAMRHHREHAEALDLLQRDLAALRAGPEPAE